MLPSHRDQKGCASCLRDGVGPGVLTAAQGGAGEGPVIPDFLHSFLPPFLGFREGGISGHILSTWDPAPQDAFPEDSSPSCPHTTSTLCCVTVGSHGIPDLQWS